MNLILCLTEQCNLRCSYCYYKDTQAARHAVMDNATLEQAIRCGLERTLAFGQKHLVVSFFGGEPLLRKDAIYNAVGFAKALVADAMEQGRAGNDFRLDFVINTNGTLFDDKFLDMCEREKFILFLSLDGPEHHQDTQRNPSGLETLRGYTHQQKHWESQHNGGKCLKHKVVGRRRLKLRIDLTHQDHAIGGCARQHAEHGEEPFVFVIGIKMLADPKYIDESGSGAQGTDDDERHNELAELIKADGGSPGHDHNVKAEATDMVQHIIINVFTAHDLHLLETIQDVLEKDAEQRAQQEVESPEQGLQGVGAEIAQLHPLNPIGE